MSTALLLCELYQLAQEIGLIRQPVVQGQSHILGTSHLSLQHLNHNNATVPMFAFQTFVQFKLKAHILKQIAFLISYAVQGL